MTKKVISDKNEQFPEYFLIIIWSMCYNKWSEISTWNLTQIIAVIRNNGNIFYFNRSSRVTVESGL